MATMPESESEDEIFDRIEVALLKIAARTQVPRLASGGEVDREALAETLDTLIERLRTGLELPGSAGQTE